MPQIFVTIMSVILEAFTYKFGFTGIGQAAEFAVHQNAPAEALGGGSRSKLIQKIHLLDFLYLDPRST